MPSISFTCLIALARTSNTIFNRSSEIRYPCLVPDLSWEAFCFCCLWLTPSNGNLVSVHLAVRLKPHSARAVSLLGSGAIVSRQAAASCRGVVCLSRISAAVWGMTQHQDPSGYSLSSLPKASVSSPLCPSLSFPEPQVSGCK